MEAMVPEVRARAHREAHLIFLGLEAARASAQKSGGGFPSRRLALEPIIRNQRELNITTDGGTMSIFEHHRRAEHAGRAYTAGGKRFLLHGLVAVAAVAGVAAFAAASAVPALANDPVHPTTTLTLGNGLGVPGGWQWAASGNTYAMGLGDVDVWVMNVTDGGWSTVEYQSGLTTSSHSIFPYNPGGLFSAAGKTHQVLIDPDVGYVTEALHPLTCGHQYEVVTYDPNDGYVYSNVLSEPACS